MDPVSMIVNALAAGATGATTDAAKATVGDLYTRLRQAVTSRISRADPPGTILEPHDGELPVVDLRDLLLASGAARDTELVMLARELLAVVVSQERSGPPLAPAAARTPELEPGPGRAQGAYPEVWEMPRRSPTFTGREDLLARVRAGLEQASPIAIRALHGTGGVGKTLLAVEYAHRQMADYDLGWWVESERIEAVPRQLADLAVAAGQAETQTPVPAATEALKKLLRSRGRWLLVFDNAEDPEALAPHIPDGPGHVLITSRNPRWTDLCDTVEIDVLPRRESIHLLRSRVPELAEQQADSLAARLGDLPLALAQAAGVLAGTGANVKDYLDWLDHEVTAALSQGKPIGHPATLAAAVRIAREKLAEADRVADQLLMIGAFLAPEPIPVSWFGAAARPDVGDDENSLPEPLASAAAQPFGLYEPLRILEASGLARVVGTKSGQSGLVIHRLTAEIVRGSLSPENQRWTQDIAQGVVLAADPRDTDSPGTWQDWNAILPHLLHLKPETSDSAGLRVLTCDAALILYHQGDYRAGLVLSRMLYEAWSRSDLGPDHLHTLFAANNLARCSFGLGSFEEARVLDEQVFAGRRRLLGDDHEITLHSVSNLARDLTALGDNERALTLHEESLARRRTLLGDEHPDTLLSANRLGGTLHALGRYEEARIVQEEVLAVGRRTLPDDHTHTLHAARDLAMALLYLGDLPAAQALHEDTWHRRCRVLGKDHANTLQSASGLASSLYALGAHQAARELHEDTLARRRAVLGDDHPHTRESERDVAACVRALGRPGTAESGPAKAD